ncbi:uncharacterized protein BP5553_01412 [Venustampulla echinocandica]|uniref:Heterokaryon incompatibility domain-containing protein n=1 Tax=Venustampulla echinocandica TaxID=2656787 RepID=A0A370U105_9HELO|nr:uncharacterized protein BP5553_01412 [Venustampulla echinocandica]RDL41433.1 hypothetical protein BP5553_01412 [Venustampulla echinocandica]
MSQQPAAVAPSTNIPDLETIWYEPDPQKLRCPICEKQFTQSALIRTFRVGQTGGRSLESLGCSGVIATHLDRDIILYDRHLDCLLQYDIAFTGVSHVWDPQVWVAQMQNRRSPQPADVRRLAIESPIHVYEGLMRDKRDEDGEELWHDYFSVPQWTGEIKTCILATIHTIFSSAATTLFYFHDLSDDLVQKLRYGNSPLEHLQGMTGRPRQDDDRRLPALGEPSDPGFLGRLKEVWDEELKKHPSVFDLERKVEMGRNLVPWNLGPLGEVKAMRTTNFAMAYALLSKRGCRDQGDFLYAVSGIITARPKMLFRNDFLTELAELARGCIEAGDYSHPLIMLGSADPRAHRNYAELGEQTSNPDSIEAPSFDADRQTVALGLEKMCTVALARHANGGVETGDAMKDFARRAALTLELTGPNLNDFVASLGTRLYGANQDIMMEALKTANSLDAVEKALCTRFNNPECRYGSWPRRRRVACQRLIAVDHHQRRA